MKVHTIEEALEAYARATAKIRELEEQRDSALDNNRQLREAIGLAGEDMPLARAIATVRAAGLHPMSDEERRGLDRRALAAEQQLREARAMAVVVDTSLRDTLLSMLHRATRELDAAGATKPAAAIREELAAMEGVSNG